MATWVVGDVHGCWATLERLLARIGWDPGRDELLLVGDLVAKGRRSLEVLRWAFAHRERVEAVLGNHDLHLLARSLGAAAGRSADGLEALLAAADVGELLGWLRQRPLLVERGQTVVVHAGLYPQWRLREARELAAACREAMSDDDRLARLWRRRKLLWRPGLVGEDRLAAALAVMTMVRTVAADGRPLLGFTGRPEAAPEDGRPWFEGAGVIAQDRREVLFGHWALLGLHRATGAMCLDGACVYGGQLAARCLDDGRVVVEAAVSSDLFRLSVADLA